MSQGFAPSRAERETRRFVQIQRLRHTTGATRTECEHALTECRGDTDAAIQKVLSRRAVACKGWRWRCGMLAALDGIDGDYRARVCRVEGDKFWSDATTLPYDLASYVPDLRDPATLGCLLALVREAWGDSEMHMTLGAKGWVWLTGESRVYDVVMPINAGATEAEALVAALEAAP